MFSNKITRNTPDVRRAKESPEIAETGMFSPGTSSLEWRSFVARGLYRTGLLRVMQGMSKNFELGHSHRFYWPRLRRVSSPKFVILCYHRVGTGGVPLYSELPAEVFEAQMRYLKKHYRLLSLGEVCRGLDDLASVPSGVAVTFDDGYRGVYTEAFPILSKYQIPATVFLTVDAIETGQIAWYDRVFLALDAMPTDSVDLELDRVRHFSFSSPRQRLSTSVEIMSCLRRLPDWRRKECCAALERLVELPEEKLANRMMNWRQVQAMRRAGIEFGSHTLSHPVVSQLPQEQMERELLGSKKILEDKLECPVLDFAFPFGQPHDCGLEKTSPIVAHCGYRSASTTVPGVNTLGASSLGLLRVQIGEERDLAMFAFRLNQLFLFADSAQSHSLNDQKPSSLGTAYRNPEAMARGGQDA